MNGPLIILAALILLLIFGKVEASGMYKVQESKFVIDVYREYTRSASRRFSVPEERLLAMIVTESSGKADSSGLAGEIGLMQILPPALSMVNSIHRLYYTTENLWDPYTNVLVGAAYLEYLNQQTKDIDEATRAYNGGLSGTRANASLSRDYLYRVKQTETTILSLL